MKIAMVTPYFYPHVGGLENYLYNLTQALAKMGHEVIIITSMEGSNKRTEDINGVKVYRLSYKYPIKNVAYLVVKGFTKYRNILNGCDVINVHGHMFYTTVMTVLMRKLRLVKKPVVITIHGSSVPYQKRILNFLEKSLDMTIGRFSISNADKIIAISKSVRQNVCRDNTKTVIVPDGINLKEFAKGDVNFRKEYGIPQGKKIVLFIGRFYWHKGITYAAEAMKRVQETEDCVFVAVGDGPLRKSTEKYCRDNGVNAIFTGFRHDIHNIMKSSDVFVFPSLSEGFGIALLEAMASDLPIVATRVGSIPELIRDGYNGYLVPVNSERIADAVVKMLRSKDVMSRLAKNGRSVVKKYDWDVVAKQIEKVFSSLT